MSQVDPFLLRLQGQCPMFSCCFCSESNSAGAISFWNVEERRLEEDSKTHRLERVLLATKFQVARPFNQQT
eukprot:scaffold222003_cov19-Tisochrysis_lutea.AAC.1